MSPSPIVGRLAPSPTGAQHVGNARTYLIAWLSLRSQGGRVLLRIEDIDSPRVKPWAIQQARDDLRWLGLDWDEEVAIQTERTPLHRQALERLQAKDVVYPCICTRSDIERAASAPHANHEGPIYPGTCAHLRADDANDLGDTPFSWRYRLPSETPSFDDGVQGQVAMDLHTLGGDFVVWKAPRRMGDTTIPDGPAYQLAVVVDDADQGVTEVVRGDDLIPSTPRQLLLYEELGFPPPRFAHVPLVVGPDGRRLAKRHGDTRLSTLRESDVRPGMLVGLLAWSCGWLPSIAPTTPRELLSRFTLATIPPEALVLTEELLREIGYHANRTT